MQIDKMITRGTKAIIFSFSVIHIGIFVCLYLWPIILLKGSLYSQQYIYHVYIMTWLPIQFQSQQWCREKAQKNQKNDNVMQRLIRTLNAIIIQCSNICSVNVRIIFSCILAEILFETYLPCTIKRFWILQQL